MNKNNGRNADHRSAGHRDTGHLGRLQEVLNHIEDDVIREVVKGVFQVEISYRSAERKNFPRQKIRDVIEGVARTIENQQS